MGNQKRKFSKTIKRTFTKDGENGVIERDRKRRKAEEIKKERRINIREVVESAFHDLSFDNSETGEI